MFSHINSQNQPQMVDVSHKEITARRAVAQAIIRLPAGFLQHMERGEILTKKGAVLQTAIIAGTMAVKRTADAIPFCHPIPITSCQFHTEVLPQTDRVEVYLRCEVKTSDRTGVEMESLHGVTIAALTVYDMCKSVSQEIVIQEIKLLAKSGGKKTLGQYPLYGLVLTGGKSKRMGRDKALLEYRGKPHAQYLYELLQEFCDRVFLSARSGQWQNTPLADLPTIYDSFPSDGPISGMLTAFQAYPQVNWLVVACDLPYLDEQNLAPLVEKYREDVVANCYYHPQKKFPEALCAIYTPQAFSVFNKYYNEGVMCPVQILAQSPCQLLEPPSPHTTANINTLAEYEEVQVNVQL
ncbi:MAG: cyclic pyranopterin monophosphate synthase MoaC [Pseudanabaenaceae cyanobacterium SKYGB_i_bin29]|nr:cyclic pyranopterin monophosphate synthase MoaC [Pseudanabaenaceae cyanobacterium SKYG29]MDW8422017.1 cyclic pyranopterin monophosphate synthase MoaC [Pseudanabaenaceae cyanobacterium SKYGB_i_bin29]